MTRRNGTTLVEVLVAIFIMAIGLMTLLTLFPLGALSMSQAIKDTRTGHAAANAAALAEAMNLRHGAPEQVVPEAAFNNPTTLGYRLPNITTLDIPSFPVYVDPLGVLADTAVHSQVGTLPSGIPRVMPSFVNGPMRQDYQRQAARWFTGLDDMNFQKDGPGAGTPAGGSTIEREGRYSWAYLLRRPRQSDSSVCDVSVVVYSGRPALLAPSTYETTFQNIGFDTNSNIVRVPYAGTKPDIRKGSWILDSTTYKPAGATQTTPEPHGFFYRVVGVTDLGNALALELQDRPKLSTTAGGNYGRLVFMDNVVEVFEKGAGWQP